MIQPWPDANWSPRPGATEAAVEALIRASPVPLPNSYLEHLRISNGGEGDLGIEPGWIVFWNAEEVLDNNRDYRISEDVPDLLGFATNGAGELLAFDTRGGAPYPIVMVPFIPLELEEAVVIATDFSDLLRHVGRPSSAA